MDNQLTRILDHKREEVRGQMRERSTASLRSEAESVSPARDFLGQLRQRVDNASNAVIAEIKQASPSKGLLTTDFNPKAIAKAYTEGGACCLSVLTDRVFFRGDKADLTLARTHSPLPVLRKDFIIDPYQIYQTKAMGADALLLIVAALDQNQLVDYFQLGQDVGLSVLIEIHDHHELERALTLNPPLIGINNRNLATFETNLAVSEELAPLAQQAGALVVAESGVHHRDHITRLNATGIYAFLIGESLITQRDRRQALAHLLA